jgi:hypothetical protein
VWNLDLSDFDGQSLLAGINTQETLTPVNASGRNAIKTDAALPAPDWGSGPATGRGTGSAKGVARDDWA